MSNDDNNKMANQFIELWQENFAKTMQDPEIMLQLTKAMGFMQQFYGQPNFTQSNFSQPNFGQGQPASATAAAASQPGADELRGDELLGRISELEERVARLEAAGRTKSGKKKTS